ncbi:MAG: tRNA pseudouridine synthase A [Planctomycetota bacterium]
MARETDSLMRTLRMTLAYDGTNYCGWQLQPNGVSLQQVVEHALSQFTHEPIRVTASGRTDAGVHAIGQVISFETTSTAPCHGFLHGLPVHLPDDVVVRAVEEAPSGFNARYDAKRKWYRYVIHNSPTRLPFLRTSALWQRSHLNDQSMHEAAGVLLGTHDFRCFETQWPNRSSSIRTVFRSTVTRAAGWPVWGESNEQRAMSHEPETVQTVAVPSTLNPQPSTFNLPFLCFDIEADGFLYNMVRAIVGTLIHVGRGRWSADDMRRILETGDRSAAGETAPAHGLCLMRVDYDVNPAD